MNATVDAAGDGQQAEIDDQGRYKVILPFDQSGNKDGKASRWVRMAQPYAGSEYGMHFPLHKGAEVLLTFVDGDPDRPIISGSVPNPETTSPVTSANQTKSVVRDNFGNEMIFDATPGDEHIRLFSPHHNSAIELGRSFWKYTDSEEAQLGYGNSITANKGNKFTCVGGFDLSGVLGASVSALVGLGYRFSFAQEFAWNLGFKSDFSVGSVIEDSQTDVLFKAKEDFIIGAGDEFCLAAGTQNPPGHDSQNKSVIRATPDGITLALGEELTETGEGIGKGDWWQPKGKLLTFKEQLWPLAGLLVTLAGSFVTLLPKWTGSNKQEREQQYNDWSRWGNLAQIVSFIIGAVYYRKYLSDDLIEPVRHKEPSQKIWIHRDGTIGIISTKARDREQGRIVLGVNKQETNKQQVEGWKYYDDYLDFEDKDTKWYAGRVRKITLDKVMKKVRRKSLKESAKHKKLGLGSNIVIERDKIWLRSGEPGKESLAFSVDNKSQNKLIGLFAYNPNKQAEQAYITVARNDGTININNKKRNAQINIISKKDISLTTSGGDIGIDAGSNEIYFRSKAKVKTIEGKNFKAL